MRTRKAVLNVAFSLLSQLVSVVCGFLVPIALIGSFGSDTYGAIGSITQFLGFIALLESGVGGVTRAALYGPLAKGDIGAVSSVVRATESFFRKVGIAFVPYAVAVAVAFPHITSYAGSRVVAWSLTAAISAGILAQYLFGITYSVLLQADQRSYVTSGVQIATTALNAALVVSLVHAGLGVVQVEAASAVVFVLRPILLGAYVRRRYQLDGRAAPDRGAIKERWSGLGHHLAFFLRSNVSVVALSVLAPLSSVAVFNVYNLIAAGLQRLVNSFSSGLEAAFGNMIANGEGDALRTNFRAYELISSTLVVCAFSTGIVSAVPFVEVYTSGVADADYVRPAFSAALLLATAAYCLRLPYNSVTLAAGHYRQTCAGAFAEAAMAVVLTFALVPPMGVLGAALALLAASVFRLVQYAVYSSRHILERPISEFVGRCAYVAVGMGASCALGLAIRPLFEFGGYLEWAAFAAAALAASCAVAALMCAIFYRDDVRVVAGKLRFRCGR